MWVPVLIAVAWLAIGATVGVLEARSGYWRRGWILAAVFGPLAIPLALQRRRTALPEPVVLREGRAREGTIDVLIGIDGSPAAEAAVEEAIELFGNRIHRLGIATVIDRDTAAPHSTSLLYPAPWPEEVEARRLLERTAGDLRNARGLEALEVVLAGEPAEALRRHARAEGYRVIVIGCRGSGASKLLLGSCASRLARDADVPVLLVPSHRNA